MAESEIMQTYPSGPEGRLIDYWDRPVRKLVVLEAPNLEAGQRERHAIYSLLVMALVSAYWNGNKRGPSGDYPWRKKQRDASGRYLGDTYFGHNIAAVAVDAAGRVIDFDFNHNDLMNSSVEHAESRLVRRVFSLTQIYANWFTRAADPSSSAVPYSTLLSDVTIYTSLESCSQCSGIMALGSVKEVVFLQRDPGQNSIGNILRNLGPIAGRYLPPLPLPANMFDFKYFECLVDAFRRFEAGVGVTPFYTSPEGTVDSAPSITSFLCTDDARDFFSSARRDLESLSLKYPTFTPKLEAEKVALPNIEVLEHVKRFLSYASVSGHRGTPHTL